MKENSHVINYVAFRVRFMFQIISSVYKVHSIFFKHLDLLDTDVRFNLPTMCPLKIHVTLSHFRFVAGLH
jgi:acetone carboxylase gamma subunit